MREEDEKKSNIINFKYDFGGMMDVEFIISYLVLSIDPQIVREVNYNIFDLIDMMKKRQLISTGHHSILYSALNFFHTLKVLL